MLPNLSFKTNEIIDKEEQALYEIYNFQVEKGRKEFIAAGIDGGSTHTRVNILTKNDINPYDLSIIPSKCVLAGDEESVTVSEKLIDNMDSCIIDTTGRVDAMFSKERVLRGRKMEDSGLSPTALTTTKQKIKEKLFYVNIIDALGYAICMKYQDAIPEKVKVALAVALPPDDMASQRNRDEFTSSITGSYIWKGFEGHISIEIDINEVIMDTEPHAFAWGYWLNLLSQGQLKQLPKNVICINTGGRSTGIDLIKNSHRVPTASDTFNECGKSFMKMVKSKIVEVQGGKAPSDAPILEAMNTGKLPRGNSSIDVTDYIRETAETFGEYYYKDILSICDAGDVELLDINEVIICGGLTRRGDYDISFTDTLGTLIKNDSEDTVVSVIEDNFIPFGLSYTVYNQVKDTLFADEEEEEEIEEVDLAEDEQETAISEE